MSLKLLLLIYLKETIAFYFKYIGNPNFSGQKEKDKKQNRMVNSETYILGTKDRHLPQ